MAFGQPHSPQTRIAKFQTGSYPGSYQQARSYSRARSLEKRGSRPRSLESTGNPDSDGLNTRGKIFVGWTCALIVFYIKTWYLLTWAVHWIWFDEIVLSHLSKTDTNLIVVWEVLMQLIVNIMTACVSKTFELNNNNNKWDNFIPIKIIWTLFWFLEVIHTFVDPMSDAQNQFCWSI